MHHPLTKTLAALAISGVVLGASVGPAHAAPPVADTQSGSASGSAKTLLAWPLGFILFGACFADGDSPVHNPLCQSLLDLTAGSARS